MPIPASSVLPSLDDFKAHINVTSTTHDTELQDMLNAAAELVAQHVGPLDVETVTDEVHDGGSGALILRQYPVVEVTAAAYWDGTAVDVADLEIDGGTGIVSWGYNTAGSFSAGSRNVRVTYTVGRTTLPAPLRLAILIVAAHLWETQMGGGNAVPPYPGADVEGVPTAGFAVPNRALELMRPYMLGPAVA